MSLCLPVVAVVAMVVVVVVAALVLVLVLVFSTFLSMSRCIFCESRSLTQERSHTRPSATASSWQTGEILMAIDDSHFLPEGPKGGAVSFVAM